MVDKEKIINGLEWWCKNQKGEPLLLAYSAVVETLEVLKEHDVVKPIPPTDESDLWKCGNCNHQLIRCTHQRYCEMCGKPILWEGR